MTDYKNELKQSFEQNLLDGDGIQAGQMIASTHVWEWLDPAIEALLSKRELETLEWGYVNSYEAMKDRINQLTNREEK